VIHVCVCVCVHTCARDSEFQSQFHLRTYVFSRSTCTAVHYDSCLHVSQCFVFSKCFIQKIQFVIKINTYLVVGIEKHFLSKLQLHFCWVHLFYMYCTMYVTLYRCVYTRCRGHNLLSTPPEHRKPIIVFLPRANTFWKSHPPRVQAPRPRPRPPIVSFSWRLESARGARPKHQCNLFDCQRVILGCLKNPKNTKNNKRSKRSQHNGPLPPTTHTTDHVPNAFTRCANE
jgi:hypothetical protein